MEFKTDFLKFRKPNCNLFDNFHYNYEALTINGLGQDIGSKNRLFQVTDAIAPTIKTDDFDSQVNADNYVYDLLGRVVEDKAKNLVQTYNKENKITTQTIGSKVITYKYDFQSKRVSKTVVNGSLTTTEYYVRDPQGNVLAIYADTLQNSRKFTLSELHIYGSSRLGIYKVDSELYSQNGSTIVIATSSNKYSFKLGQKRYELSNHLGNVQTVITDRKLVDTNAGGLITAYKADVQSVTDYYPFGKTIPERTWSISKTRYDFNGKETDQESGYQDYGFRDYDVEICRFLQVDPLHGKYPWNSTYQFAGNKPINSIDGFGLEEIVTIIIRDQKSNTTFIFTFKDSEKVTTDAIGDYYINYYHTDITYYVDIKGSESVVSKQFRYSLERGIADSDLIWFGDKPKPGSSKTNTSWYSFGKGVTWTSELGKNGEYRRAEGEFKMENIDLLLKAVQGWGFKGALANGQNGAGLSFKAKESEKHPLLFLNLIQKIGEKIDIPIEVFGISKDGFFSGGKGTDTFFQGIKEILETDHSKPNNFESQGKDTYSVYEKNENNEPVDSVENSQNK